MLSLVLASKILSLFLIMAVGFVLVRSRVVKPEHARGLALVNVYAISPCMIVSAFQVTLTQEVWSGFVLALGAGCLIQICYLGLSWMFGKLLHLDRVERASCIYSNAGNLIIPLVTMTLGQDMVVYCTAYLLFQTLFLFSHGKALVRGAKGVDLREMFLSINMLAVYLGLVLFVTGWRFPEPVTQAIDSIAGMIGPSSMLVTGIVIGSVDFKRLLSFKRLPIPVLLRLVVLPLFALVILKFSPLATLVPNGHLVLLTTLLAACAPSASTINQFAQIYGRHAEYASAINVSTMLLCIVTMPLMVALYQM